MFNKGVNTHEARRTAQLLASHGFWAIEIVRPYPGDDSYVRSLNRTGMERRFESIEEAYTEVAK